MIPWKARGSWLGPASRPLVMGILNLTSDSFSDGGCFLEPDRAVAHALRMIDDGADIIDIGGESSRPGSAPVSLAEELDRVIPVVELLANRTRVPLSIDTTKVEVARAAINAKAAVINDIAGLSSPEMLRAIGESDVGVVVMHMQGVPSTMQVAPTYRDVVAEVADFLAARVAAAGAAGISQDRIAIDPGIGFGKSIEHNLALLRNLPLFESIGCPVLIGTSRKGFLGKLTGREVGSRVAASVASALAAVVRGASIVRVHDVAETVDAFQLWGAQVGWGDGPRRDVTCPRILT